MEQSPPPSQSSSQSLWAQVLWRENNTLFAPNYADGYFGEADPAAEARHVFCEGLALPAAWERFFDDKNTFRIVELGFGTGLNFLQTAQLWQKWQQAKTRKTEILDYWGIEAHPLRLEDLQRFYRHYEVCGSENLLRVWGKLQDKSGTSLCCQPVVRWEFSPSLRITLLLQDIDTALHAMQVALPREVDGWYCDGFAPRSNPAMWSEKVFSALARCTRARTDFPQLASFSVAKSVRTAAEAYGFSTHKRKGLLTKREVLQGFFQANNSENLP